MAPAKSENFSVVVVRDWSKAPLVRAVLDATDDAVFVCRIESVAKIRAGEMEPPIAGMPREDVFLADPELVARIKCGGKISWGELTPF